MNNISINNNQENIQNNIQAKISFRKDMKTLRMNLPGIDKSLKGHNYKYQDFNDIVEEIENVIKKHNLELDFFQNATFTHDLYGRVHVVRTTFYSTSTGYEESFDTPMLTENLQWNNENGSKNVNITLQLVGSAITYFKRYALVGHLNIRSEVDTDKAPIYNNYENRNSMPNKQVNVSQKQEKNKRLITIRKNNNSEQQNYTIQKQKKDSFYHYGIFKEALSNIKNWVHDFETKDI